MEASARRTDMEASEDGRQWMEVSVPPFCEVRGVEFLHTDGRVFSCATRARYKELY